MIGSQLLAWGTTVSGNSRAPVDNVGEWLIFYRVTRIILPWGKKESRDDSSLVMHRFYFELPERKEQSAWLLSETDC